MRKKTFFSLGVLSVSLGLPKVALAHCPLCTVGAGMAALFAIGLGVNAATVGVFIGAFAVALGLWLGRLVPWNIQYKKELLGLLSFLLTVVPLLPLMEDYSSIYLMWFGSYGSPFQRVYLVNRFLLGSAVGLVMVWFAPLVSLWVTKLLRGKHMPYQGMAMTFVLLGLAAFIIEFLL